MNTLIEATGSSSVISSKPIIPPHKCEHQVLLKENFLSEFLTKAEKQKVLKNLGISSLESDKYVVKNDTNAASQIPYTNSEYTEVSNVKEALDRTFKGGLHIVASITDRDNIPTSNLESGMLCYVQSVREYYQLKEDLTWKVANFGTTIEGGGIVSVDYLTDLDKDDYKVAGTIIYVTETEAFYEYTPTNGWQSFASIYVGSEEPADDTVLWIDPLDTASLNDEDDKIQELQSNIKNLELKVQDISRLITTGIVPGDVTNSYRRAIMSTADPVKPDDATGDDDDDDDTEWKPDTGVAEPTVYHNAAKQDTAANFAKNKNDLIDGELLFYTDKKRFVIYYQGSFYAATSGSSSSSESSGITPEELETLPLSQLIFYSGDQEFKVRCTSDGKLIATPYSSDTTLPGSKLATWNVYIEHLLCMNSIFCGGEGSEDAQVSHNFVELANGSTKDINLKGLYLLYTDCTKEDDSDVGFIWKVLPLEGIIKAGSTFLIRGNQCNMPKACMIRVESYDMEWGISFNQEHSSFYLCAGDGYKELLETKTLKNPWVSKSTRVGYIDSCGFGDGSVGEGSSQFLVRSDWNKTLFVRWFMLEPAKQGNKAHDARKTTDLWTYIDLDKQTTKEGNSVQYYYNDALKQKYTPMASSEGKTFFTVKTKFSDKHANYIIHTYGIQATDNGSGATRCFNWISVGYYNEFVEIKKTTDTTWTKYESITSYNATSDQKKFIDHYQRLRWMTSDGTLVTTHKCIISGLTAGDYEYRITREDDSSYTSDTLTFTIKSNADVKSFTYIQTTDQQGFNWAEYQAWSKSADIIAKDSFDFIVNTGDITQSGNRVSEWMDYYNGRKPLNHYPEMFSIGNNDLCGHVSTELTDGEDATSKYNHINVLRYFTFELDPNNDYSFTWGKEGEAEETYPLYSLYSFNYGDWHFISLNSEIAKASSKMYKDWTSSTEAGDETFAKTANAKIEAWLQKDLQNWTGQSNPTNCSKCIVYMHEMPLTIVTYSFMAGTSARVGSHLNTLNSNGNYRFSRLFKQYGIRLVMGGHKHTYCITKPVYDAPTGYITDNHKIDSSVDFLGPVSTADSRKPVIQVTDSSQVETNDYARYEIVSKINAPTYVMSQATGYKLVSNKEQPSGDAYTIPWLLAYYKARSNDASPTENVAQHKPMYIKYDVTDTDITVTAKQIENVWNVNVQANTKSYDMNNQQKDINVTAVTCDQTSSTDKSTYNITDSTKYTITL